MQAEYVLNANERPVLGTGNARALRREGYVPAVIYGKGKENLHLAISQKEVNMLFNSFEFNTTPVTIKLGKTTIKALPKDALLHPVTDQVEQIDFMFLDGAERIKVDVPVYFKGRDKSPGIKLGGVLNIVFRKIKVYADPKSIPDSIEVDLSSKVVGDSIRLRDITFPKNVTPIEKNLTLTVCKIVGKRAKLEESANAEQAAAK